MKVFILLMAITALAAARRKPCRVLYQNGTLEENACDAPGGMTECEQVEDIPELLDQIRDKLDAKFSRIIPADRADNIINKIMERISERLENVQELSICKPIRCNSDAVCAEIDPNSVCTKDFEPDYEAMQALKSQCFPDRPVRPRFPRNDVDEDDEDEDDDDNRPTRCSLPPAYRLARKACSLTLGGVTTTRDCRRGTCSSQTCSFRLANQDATASFCRGGRRRWRWGPK